MMMLMRASLLLLLGLFAATIVIAYNFEDSDYNEFLMQDLIALPRDDETDEPSAGLRRKRDTDACHPPMKKHHGFYKCCNDGADNDQLYEQFNDLKRECQQSYRAKHTNVSGDMFSCDKINRTKEEFVCVNQCVARSINIVDDNGNLIPAAVRNYTQHPSRASWHLTVANNVSATCIAADANATAATAATASVGNNAINTTTEAACNPAALRLFYCLWREFTRACPRELHSAGKRCVTLRDRLASGGPDDYGKVESQVYQSFRDDNHHQHHHHHHEQQQHHHRNHGPEIIEGAD